MRADQGFKHGGEHEVALLTTQLLKNGNYSPSLVLVPADVCLCFITKRSSIVTIYGSEDYRIIPQHFSVPGMVNLNYLLETGIL